MRTILELGLRRGSLILYFFNSFENLDWKKKEEKIIDCTQV